MLNFFIKISLVFRNKSFYYDRLREKDEDIFFDFVFKKYIENNWRVNEVLKCNKEKIGDIYSEERSLPGEDRFQKSGWWRIMFLRYGLAMFFAENKTVLDTCSGLGWGAFLLDGVAKNVTCIELDEKSVLAAKRLWPTNKTSYQIGSVLKMPLPSESYDVVTAMESIEHFTLLDLKIYLKEIHRVLKSGGFLVGSSAFPDAREDADSLCSKNKHHLYICTKKEIINILGELKFKKIKVFGNRIFFVAQK